MSIRSILGNGILESALILGVVVGVMMLILAVVGDRMLKVLAALAAP